MISCLYTFGCARTTRSHVHTQSCHSGRPHVPHAQGSIFDRQVGHVCSACCCYPIRLLLRCYHLTLPCGHQRSRYCRPVHACVLLFKLFKQSPQKRKCTVCIIRLQTFCFSLEHSLRIIYRNNRSSAYVTMECSLFPVPRSTDSSQFRSKRSWNSPTGSRGAKFPPGPEAYPRRSTSRSEGCCGGVFWFWFLEVQHNEQIHMHRW